MSAKSDRSNTLLALFISNQDLSCSFTEAVWLEQEASDCTSIILHMHANAGGEKMIRAFEAFVHTKGSMLS